MIKSVFTSTPRKVLKNIVKLGDAVLDTSPKDVIVGTIRTAQVVGKTLESTGQAMRAKAEQRQKVRLNHNIEEVFTAQRDAKFDAIKQITAEIARVHTLLDEPELDKKMRRDLQEQLELLKTEKKMLIQDYTVLLEAERAWQK